MVRSICLFVALLPVAGCAESDRLRPKAAQLESSCADISEARSRTVLNDLETSVDRVDAVREPAKTKPFIDKPVGADIHVRATPGMTAPWLARLVRCHLVREECGASCESPTCPLGLRRITTSVSHTALGFTIAIRSSDDDVAREIARRARIYFDHAAMGPAGAVLQSTADAKIKLATQHF